MYDDLGGPALKKAADEIMPLFRKCPRDHQWVDESCWNEQRGLCLGCAPKLAAEMEARRTRRGLWGACADAW